MNTNNLIWFGLGVVSLAIFACIMSEKRVKVQEAIPGPDMEKGTERYSHFLAKMERQLTLPN